MMKTSRSLLGMLSMGAMVALALQPAAVLAQAGSGINLGEVTISPYMEIKGILDDNVRLDATDEEEDSSVEAKLGASASHSTDSIGIDAGLWGRLERYSDLDAEDHEDWGQNIKIRFGDSEGLNVLLNEDFSSIDELDYGTGTIEARDTLNAAATISKQMTDKLSVDAQIGYNETDYESDRLFDWEQTYASVAAAHTLTDKSAATLTAKFATQDNDSFTSENDIVTVLAGLKTRGTDKLTGSIGLGVREHDQSDLSGFSFDVKGQWAPTEQLTVQATLANSVEPVSEAANNSREITSGTIEAIYKIQEAWFATLGGTLRTDDYDQAVEIAGVSVDREDDTLSAKFRLTYVPPESFLQVFVEGQVRDRESNAPARDFSQNVASAGVSLTY
jgi:hypothetical protein